MSDKKLCFKLLFSNAISKYRKVFESSISIAFYISSYYSCIDFYSIYYNVPTIQEN